MSRSAIVLLAILALPCALGLGGCGPRQYAPLPNLAAPVPKDAFRIFIGNEFAQPDSDSAVRTALKVYVDGALVGKTGTKGFFAVDHRPGKYTVTVEGCQVAGELAGGEQVCLLLAYDARNTLSLTTVGNENAQVWIAKYKAPKVPEKVYSMDDQK